jgi:hypothetical protein
VNFTCGLGATYLGEGLGGFLVLAPLVSQVEVHILSPEERLAPYGKTEPASKFQPEGVHGPSQEKYTNPKLNFWLPLSTHGCLQDLMRNLLWARVQARVGCGLINQIQEIRAGNPAERQHHAKEL